MIRKEIPRFIDKESVITNIQTLIAYDSTSHGYFCTVLIDFMFIGKILTDFTNLLLPENFKKNDKFILDYSLK